MIMRPVTVSVLPAVSPQQLRPLLTIAIHIMIEVIIPLLIMIQTIMMVMMIRTWETHVL
jgi:hypothetical protein